MTVSSETSSGGPYTGNGVTTSFAYEFLVVDETHILVLRAEGGVSEVVNPSEYAVSGVGSPLGGNVSFSIAPTSAQKITILRNVPFTQAVDLENQGAFFAEVIETALDLAAMRDQQMQEVLSRTIRVVPGVEGGEVPSLEAVLEAEALAASTVAASAAAEEARSAAEAAAALAIDAQENLFDAWTGAWQAATAYIVGDLAREGGTTYICLVAHTSGTFLTDLGAGRWEAFAARGDAGAGTGDVLAANNGSEYDAAAFRSTLSIQQSNARLADVAGATYAQGDLVYFNGTNLVPLVKGAAAQTLKMNPGATAPAWIGGVIGPTATTSGTEVTFTGIPSGVTRVEILFNGVSFSGSTGDSLRIQLGDSGGFETTGYQSASAICTTAALTTLSTTLSFLVSVGVDVRVVSGQMVLTRGAGNDWYQSHGAYSETSRAMSGGGTKTLSSELTQIKLLGTEGGTFDAGSVTVRYS